MTELPAVHTLDIAIDRDPASVYRYVSDPRNLPAWAPGLCTAVRPSGGGWIVDTPQGPMGFRFVATNALGVLDHYVSPSSGPEIYVPMRVVANGAGSALLFTLFRSPEVSDARFAEDIALVQADLARLKAMLES